MAGERKRQREDADDQERLSPRVGFHGVMPAPSLRALGSHSVRQSHGVRVFPPLRPAFASGLGLAWASEGYHMLQRRLHGDVYTSTEQPPPPPAWQWPPQSPLG